MISTISGRPDYAVNREYGRKHHSHLKGEVVENASFQVKTQTSLTYVVKAWSVIRKRVTKAIPLVVSSFTQTSNLVLLSIIRF